MPLICANVPMEERVDVVKHLERAYERCLFLYMKIEFGDFNGRVGKEGVFGTTVGEI